MEWKLRRRRGEQVGESEEERQTSDGEAWLRRGWVLWRSCTCRLIEVGVKEGSEVKWEEGVHDEENDVDASVKPRKEKDRRG